jgi:hypothetical protein
LRVVSLVGAMLAAVRASAEVNLRAIMKSSQG